MSYLEEWEKIEKKYDYHIAKDLALIHIAKCLSVLADSKIDLNNMIQDFVKQSNVDFNPYDNVCRNIGNDTNNLVDKPFSWVKSTSESIMN